MRIEVDCETRHVGLPDALTVKPSFHVQFRQDLVRAREILCACARTILSYVSVRVQFELALAQNYLSRAEALCKGTYVSEMIRFLTFEIRIRPAFKE